MRMGLVIEIKNNEILIVNAKVKKSVIEVGSHLSFDIPEKMVNQNGVMDRDTFALMLSQHLETINVKRKECYVCLNNNSVIYREILIPRVEEKQLGLLVRSEMMNALHLTPDYLMDYVILAETVHEGSPMYRVLAVAILENAIKSYIAAFRKANLKVRSLDTAMNAIRKIIESYVPVNLDHQFVVADIQRGQLKLYLFDKGVYVLTRNIRLSAFSDDNTETIFEEVFESISKMNQFSFSRNDKGIQDIVFVGVDEVLPLIKDRISESLGISTRLVSEVINKTEISGFVNKYANAIGTLIRK